MTQSNNQLRWQSELLEQIPAQDLPTKDHPECLLEFLKEGSFLRLSSEKVWVTWGQHKLSSETEAHLQTMDFFGSEVLAVQAEHQAVWKKAELQRALRNYLDSQSNPLRSAEWIEPQRTEFFASLQEIQGRIHRGEISKAVNMATWRGHREVTLAQRAHWIHSLLQAPQNLWPFGRWQTNSGILGASPEVLFYLHHDDLYSMALAGTQILANEPAQSLLKDPKERREHELVVEDLVQVLGKFGRVRRGDLQIMDLPGLRHLLTEIEVRVKDRTPSELIRALHPTPALGVAPRNYGYSWLRGLNDQSDRGQYGGPVAFQLAADQCFCLVAIRAVRWQGTDLQLSAGGGIVNDSDSEKEWREVNGKAQSILRLLGENSPSRENAEANSRGNKAP